MNATPFARIIEFLDPVMKNYDINHLDGEMRLWETPAILHGKLVDLIKPLMFISIKFKKSEKITTYVFTLKRDSDYLHKVPGSRTLYEGFPIIPYNNLTDTDLVEMVGACVSSLQGKSLSVTMDASYEFEKTETFPMTQCLNLFVDGGIERWQAIHCSEYGLVEVATSENNEYWKMFVKKARKVTKKLPIIKSQTEKVPSCKTKTKKVPGLKCHTCDKVMDVDEALDSPDEQLKALVKENEVFMIGKKNFVCQQCLETLLEYENALTIRVKSWVKVVNDKVVYKPKSKR